MKSKNQKLLLDFSVYCAQHPEERFWQALINWSNSITIYKAKYDNLGESKIRLIDTFYFEEKDK